jgi:polysaccharide chain length determinant protein (PEP-CTERM system associated)
MHEKINEIYGYLHGLWRYRWSALLIAWIIGVIGWLVVYALPDQYSSKTAIYIDTTSIMQPLLEGLSVDTDPAEQLIVMTRVLLSRDNLLAVLRETDMDHEADSREEKERLALELADDVTLVSSAENARRRGAQPSIYEIHYTSSSPEQSYKVVSALLNALIEKMLNKGRTDTVMAESFLSEQILEHEVRLDNSEKRMAEFKKKNAGFMPNDRGSYYQRLQSAEDQIAATKSSLRLAKQRYADLRKQLSGDMALGGSTTSASAARMRDYQIQLEGLLTQFTEEHPDVQALRARIAAQEANMSTESASGGTKDMTNSLLYQELKVQESQARIAVGRQQILLAEQQRQLEELQQSVDIIPQVEADLAKLDRDYQITKERYLSLVERRESARMAQKVEQSSSEITIKVVDPPVIPLWPSGPDRPLLLAGVLLGALAAAGGWSLLMFMLFPTYVDTGQLRNQIDLPVLGAISLHMSARQKKYRRTQLTSYLLAMSLLFGMFGGVLLFQETGSAYLRVVISELSVYL